MGAVCIVAVAALAVLFGLMDWLTVRKLEWVREQFSYDDTPSSIIQCVKSVAKENVVKVMLFAGVIVVLSRLLN